MSDGSAGGRSGARPGSAGVRPGSSSSTGGGRGEGGGAAGGGRVVRVGGGSGSSVVSGGGAAPLGGGVSGGGGLVRKERLAFTLADLVLSTTVGTGTFGRVRIVQHRASGAWHALKILKKSEIIRLRQVEHIKSEVRILCSVFHPFIVNLLGHMQDESRLYMLFEYVAGGELFSYLRREGRISDSAARFYASEIVLVFAYLHSLDIIYRDLKPENLLLSAKGHLKVTDFGFAKVVPDRTYTLCGTPEYLAPEIIQSTGHSKGVDWWAVGILIFEMLAGFPPFYDETPMGIYQRILAGAIDWPRHFTADAKDLLRKLLTADRTRRLGCLRGGAADVKDHPWFHVDAPNSRLNWDVVNAAGLTPPYIPRVRGAADTSNFDSYPDSDSEGRDTPSLTPSDAALFAELG